MTLLQPMMVAALLIGGMGLALLGSVKVPLANRLQIDEVRVGGLVSLFGFIMIPVILTAGFLTDLLGRQIVLMSGCTLLAASLGLLALARRYSVALLAVVLLSGGWSLLTNVVNVLTPKAFGGSETFSINLGNVIFGLGAFLTPLAVAFLVRKVSLPATLGLLACVVLVPAALAPGVDLTVKAGSQDTQTSLLGDPVMWLCGFALFFYGPLEASLAAWSTTYLTKRGVGENTASGLLSAFWLAFMLARLATAFGLPAGREAILILVLAIVCIPVLLGMVLSKDRWLAMTLVIAAGLTFGPIFPTIMSILLGHFPEQVHGRAVGVLFAIGGIGWTTIPILIGAYARRTSVQRGFSIAVGAAVCLSVVALLLVLR